MVYSTSAPWVQKRGCWATSRFSPHQRTGKEVKDKNRVSFCQATVRCLLRGKTQNRIGGGENQKYEWKHTFKRTTSDSNEA